MMQRIPELTWKDLKNLVKSWSEQYCRTALYWRINGRPVCSVLNLTDFSYHYGSTVFSLMLIYLRKVMREAIGEDPFLVGVVSEISARNVFLANYLPIDATTGYALLPNWRENPIQNYKDLIEQRIKEWYLFQKHLNVPFFPVVVAGWDASTRGENLSDLRMGKGFPWTPIVEGVTPELFGYFLDQAIEFNLRMHPELNFVFINAWNEWTESSVIEPSDRFGTAFLEIVKNRADKFSALGS